MKKLLIIIIGTLLVGCTPAKKLTCSSNNPTLADFAHTVGASKSDAGKFLQDIADMRKERGHSSGTNTLTVARGILMTACMADPETASERIKSDYKTMTSLMSQ